jgi:hypothetical protein
MPDGPRKASLRAPTLMERIKSGIQDTVGIPEHVWGMPMPDENILAQRKLTDARAAKGPVIRPNTMLESVRDTLQPITSVVELLGDPLSMGDLGPAKAISLVARAKGGLPGRLTGEAELLERLIPRNAMGEALDYRQNPNIYKALTDLIDSHPRVASHVNSIEVDPNMAAGWKAAFSSSDRITKQIQNHGAEAWKAGQNGPIGIVKINPSIETEGPGKAAESLFHEFNHAAQYIADPRRFHGTYDTMRDALNRRVRPGPATRHQEPGYVFNNAEIASRAVGKRAEQRALGQKPQNYREVVRSEGPPGVDDGVLEQTWRGIRNAWEKEQARLGNRIAPIKLPPPRPPAPRAANGAPAGAKPGQPTLFNK